MTDTPKPLTADEVAAWRDIATDEPTKGWQPTAVMRLIATIEQRDKELAAIKETAGKVLDAYMALSKSLDEVGNALRGEKP